MSLLTHLHNSPNRPRFHGNGFLQLYLGETRRLHIWHPSLLGVADNNALIHNHRYGVVSEIIHGTLIHNVFDPLPNAVGGWRISNIVGKDGASIEQLPARYDVKDAGEYRMATGTKYWFPHPYFHTSRAEELTVTVFQIGPHEAERPQVLHPQDQDPTDAFASQLYAESVLWGIIDSTLTQISAEAYLKVEKAVEDRTPFRGFGKGSAQ